MVRYGVWVDGVSTPSQASLGISTVSFRVGREVFNLARILILTHTLHVLFV